VLYYVILTQIISPGNDLASNLLWALLSNSLVIAPANYAHHSIFVNPNIFKPWIHFVPIENLDCSDFHDKIDYCLTHDKECQKIAENGTEYIKNVFKHFDNGLLARILENARVDDCDVCLKNQFIKSVENGNKKQLIIQNENVKCFEIEF